MPILIPVIGLGVQSPGTVLGLGNKSTLVKVRRKYVLDLKQSRIVIAFVKVRERPSFQYSFIKNVKG